MSWNKTVMTKSGEELLSKMLNGSKLTFTRVVVGNETVDEEDLPNQTEILSPIPAPALIVGKQEAESKNGVTVLIQIRNDGMLETSRMKQIGIYAKSEHDSEVLFLILQDEIGEEIPTYAYFSQFSIELSVVVAISRTNNIEVQSSPLVFVPRGEFEEFRNSVEKFKERIDSSELATLNAIYNSVEVSANETPAVGVKTHYYIVKGVSGYKPCEPEPDLSGVEDGVLETDNGIVQGYVQDENGTHPMALLNE